ncbi:response regulator [Donghicola sp. C2-DW-16]|uniref:Response regulator n=1 Tax=Donghicola mangrovi TaxID=2729614 RepID=A0A850Q9S2_9RHOB|nr:response regulator [Donghicola mangrovi]NVO23235.1 response regulator [Donghicola mangrovi]NVO28615.1 response regulator [Donghicola mangrovi]
MSEAMPRVLIVEDEVIVALDLSEVIEERGYEVVGPCSRLKQAEHAAREAQIDAAFLDVNLGYGATTEGVARILRERNIPFAFITADAPDGVEFRRTGEPLIRKPASHAALINCLEKWCA